MNRCGKILLSAAVLGVMSAAACNKKQNNPEQGECHGVNECKGKGDCGGVKADGTTYDCSGKNECKAKGWLKMTKKDCADKGGNFKPLSS